MCVLLNYIKSQFHAKKIFFKYAILKIQLRHQTNFLYCSCFNFFGGVPVGELFGSSALCSLLTNESSSLFFDLKNFRIGGCCCAGISLVISSKSAFNAVLDLRGLCLKVGSMLACFFWKGLASDNFFLTLNSGVAGMGELVSVWRELVLVLGVCVDEDCTSVDERYSVFE